MSIDDQNEKHILPKLLFNVSDRELHRSMMFTPEEVGGKESAEKHNIITISDLTLCTILPPQLNNMLAYHKFTCVCKCCIFEKSMNSSYCHMEKYKTEVTKLTTEGLENLKYIFLKPI